jgi:hypothetical protein
MADILGAKRRKQVGYFTDCPPWFKAEYSLRMESLEFSSIGWELWTRRSSNQQHRVMRRRSWIVAAAALFPMAILHITWRDLQRIKPC